MGGRFFGGRFQCGHDTIVRRLHVGYLPGLFRRCLFGNHPRVVLMQRVSGAG